MHLQLSAYGLVRHACFPEPVKVPMLDTAAVGFQTCLIVTFNLNGVYEVGVNSLHNSLCY